MHDRKLKIVQLFKVRWRIENTLGDIIQNDIVLNTPFLAEEYIKSYISSFLCYSYEVVLLPKEKK